jgi:hypothetical protein
MSRFGTFNINGTEYDLDDLDLDDVEEFEEITGKEFGEGSFTGAKAMKAMAFLLLRRNDPTLTINDVGKVKLVAFAPPDEDMPDVGPPAESAAENGSASEPAAAGALHSVASTTDG